MITELTFTTLDLIELKRYNDSLNCYMFHKLLQRLLNRYITIHSGFYENFSILEYFWILR
jgi:hypothetical protein